MTLTYETAIARAQVAFGAKCKVIDARLCEPNRPWQKNRYWEVNIKIGAVSRWVKVPSTAATRKALEARGEPLGEYEHAYSRTKPKLLTHPPAPVKRKSSPPDSVLRLVESHEKRLDRMAKMLEESVNTDTEIEIRQDVYARNTIPVKSFLHI